MSKLGILKHRFINVILLLYIPTLFKDFYTFVKLFTYSVISTVFLVFIHDSVTKSSYEDNIEEKASKKFMDKLSEYTELKKIDMNNTQQQLIVPQASLQSQSLQQTT